MADRCGPGGWAHCRCLLAADLDEQGVSAPVGARVLTVMETVYDEINQGMHQVISESVRRESCNPDQIDLATTIIRRDTQSAFYQMLLSRMRLESEIAQWEADTGRTLHRRGGS